MLPGGRAPKGGRSVPAKEIARYGSHGRAVRVYVETFKEKGRQALVRCQWREGGKRRTESLTDSGPNRKRARVFAESTAERLALSGTSRATAPTQLQMGEAYLLAHPVPDVWRPKSLKTFTHRWRLWVAFVTPERRADTVTMEMIDAFRADLRKRDFAVNQVANIVQAVKAVFRHAKIRKLIRDNPIADYQMKLGRDQRRMSVPEWSAEECAKILAELNPRSSRRWRAYVAIVLDAVLGPRSNALLHLELTDVDLAARTVRWRPELDKLAKDREQPLPRDAVRAFRIAAVWRRRMGYDGRFIFPAGDSAGRGKRRELAAWELDPAQKRIGKKGQRDEIERPFTYSALNSALHNAANRAGVAWIDYRAMHGFRRHSLNNVLTLTGNLTRAGQWIGDTDMRTLTRSYVRERADELRDVADGMNLPVGRTT